MSPNDIPVETTEQMTPERLAEVKDLLRYESSIAFYSHRAKESMLLLVAEVERLWAAQTPTVQAADATQYGMQRSDGVVHSLSGDREYASRVLPEMRLLAGDPEARLVQRTSTTPWTAVQDGASR